MLLGANAAVTRSAQPFHSGDAPRGLQWGALKAAAVEGSTLKLQKLELRPPTAVSPARSPGEDVGGGEPSHGAGVAVALRLRCWRYSSGPAGCSLGTLSTPIGYSEYSQEVL